MTADEFRLHVHETPIGEVLIVTAAEGVVSLHPVHGAIERDLETLTHALGAPPIPEPATSLAAEATRQLDEYFGLARRRFELPLDWRLVSGFARAALREVCAIPYGETASYGEVAISAGSPGAARAVGTACARTPFSIVVPVHRVVRADGSPGEYGARPEIKRRLLDLEARADG